MGTDEKSGVIPPLTEDGLLPSGVHTTTFVELKSRFGRFETSDRRTKLCLKLGQFIDEARRSGVVQFLIVDGSFVTAKEMPEDIDVIVVVPTQHDFSSPLPPDAYNVLSGKRVRARFGFDAFVAPDTGRAFQSWIEFFTQVKGRPELRKGILKVVL